MGLIVYECQRADHQHEIIQFSKAAATLYKYFEGRNETALFVGNLNIGDSNLDGLIVKNDAIIIVEFKDYSGDLVARQNGDWTCDGKPIKGGNGGKTVFDQLKKNQRIIRKIIAEEEYFSVSQRNDIKGMVVLSQLDNYADDFDRENKAWVFATDINKIGDQMHDIKSRDFINPKTKTVEDSYIPEEDIFNFIRKLGLEERMIVTDYSNTAILPPDLFHKDYPHNGKYISTETKLAEKEAENEALKEKLRQSMLTGPVTTTENVHEITPANETAPQEKKRKFGKERLLKQFKVEKDTLDAEQLDLIDREMDHSMIVSGSAGSGKSIIAMYKAQQIIESGGNIILIAYTKSLTRYMLQGTGVNTNNNHFYYHWQWEDAGKPQADYIIVDEIQDFSEAEVNEFIAAAHKCFFFFGDTAQSIFKGIKRTISIKEISEKTGIKVSYLNSNYRLPKTIARITQPYVGVDVTPYEDGKYKSTEKEIPHFMGFDNEETEIGELVKIIKAKKMKNVGILVPKNEQVSTLTKALRQRGLECEYKYTDEKGNDITLNFKSDNPKIMTYHSAKGLQFETVMLPFYEGANDAENRKALYVAMTRTYRFLYIFYTGEKIAYPLSSVPQELYTNR